jgi:hypothetical protein
MSTCLIVILDVTTDFVIDPYGILLLSIHDAADHSSFVLNNIDQAFVLNALAAGAICLKV